MTEVSEFNKTFVERTERLFKSYNPNKGEIQKNLEFTLLLNCLLGLIITVYGIDEHCNDNVGFIPTKQINQIPALQKLSCITEKHVQEMSFYNFIRHLRNALSHDHIKVEKQSNNHLGKWKSIIVWDEKSKEKTFPDTTLTYADIELIARYFADTYLEQTNLGQTKNLS